MTKWLPVLYANYYAILVGVAREHGYALALHGSVTRDLDLVAIPWAEKSRSPSELVHAFATVLGVLPESITSAPKPHRRTAFTLPTDGGGYIDLSIINPETDSHV